MSCLFGYLTAAADAAVAATHCGQKDWRVEFWVSGAPQQPTTTAATIAAAPQVVG